jgi:hypothetical protein
MIHYFCLCVFCNQPLSYIQHDYNFINEKKHDKRSQLGTFTYIHLNCFSKSFLKIERHLETIKFKDSLAYKLIFKSTSSTHCLYRNSPCKTQVL